LIIISTFSCPFGLLSGHAMWLASCSMLLGNRACSPNLPLLSLDHVRDFLVNTSRYQLLSLAADESVTYAKSCRSVELFVSPRGSVLGLFLSSAVVDTSLCRRKSDSKDRKKFRQSKVKELCAVHLYALQCFVSLFTT
jgi:hypothetical protein